MKQPLIVFFVISMILIKKVWAKSSNCHISIWNGFCDESSFYTPYINIWKTGEIKELLRSRGPGLIDVSGLKDVYICTNGLVMHYYSNTKAMGNLFEGGELKWLPHHCALYNPTCGPGGIQPTRVLQAVLLIGHPRDYRQPALQMFTAPYYDKGWEYPPRAVLNKYINLTSLLMIGNNGECVIEKGQAGEATYRVQANHPEYPWGEESEEHKGAPNFCRLDATQYMGENDHPDNVGILEQIDQNSMALNEARIINVRNEYKGAMFWLNNDVKMSFKGCLEYPLFSRKHEEIVLHNIAKYSDSNGTLGFIGIELIDSLSPNPENEIKSKFWNTEVRGKLRSERYLVKDPPIDDGDYEEKYQEAKEKWMEARDAYNNKVTDEESGEDIKEAADAEYEAYLGYAIFHFIEEYKKIRDHTVSNLESNVKPKWDVVGKEINETNITGTLHEYEEVTRKLSKLADDVMKNPYNVNVSNDYQQVEHEAMKLKNKLREDGWLIQRLTTTAELLTTNYWRHRRALVRARDRFFRAVESVERRKMVDYEKTKWPPSDVILSLANFEAGDHTICDVLPKIKDYCSLVKPTSEEANQLLLAVQGKGDEWEISADMWRDEVFYSIERIFTGACPYIHDTAGFVRKIYNVIKAYLIGKPLPPFRVRNETSVNTSRGDDETYQSYIYNETIVLSPNLTFKRPIWDILLDNLHICEGKVKPLTFFAKTGEEGKTEILFMKYHRNNDTYQEFSVNQLFMSEQADKEFSLNWVVDLSWKIFATVLGSCMEFYHDKASLINSHLYSTFYEDFLHPLRQHWMSHFHNPVFKVIFGQYYPTGIAEKWVNICMESSFVNAGDVFYRPLRWMMVNSFSELNFFTSGPMTGSSGIYFQK